MSEELLLIASNKVSLGNLPVLRWLLRHTDQIQPISDAAVAWAAATGVTDKWTATKALGDIIVPIAADFPDLSAVFLVADAELQQQLFAQEFSEAYGARGDIIKILVDNLPAIIDAITRLWPLFSGGK